MHEKTPLNQESPSKDSVDSLEQIDPIISLSEENHENQFEGLDNAALYDWYYDHLEDLPEELSKKWEDALEVPGQNLKQLCIDFSRYVSARQRAVVELRAGVSPNADRQQRERMVQQIESLLASLRQDNFLGNGACAEVFVTDMHPDLCIKYINNNDRYIEGNNVHEEAVFLDRLADFSVEGARTPHLLHTYSGGGFVALVMERIHGVTLQRVAEGLEELPETFDLQDYFESLLQYTKRMHDEKRVVHRDLFLRNLMVDAATGKPVVIDFGKARHYALYDEKEEIDQKYDMAQLSAAKAKMREYLSEAEKSGTITKK